MRIPDASWRAWTFSLCSPAVSSSTSSRRSKLVLTWIIVTVAPQTLAQLWFGIVVNLLWLMLHLRMRPYTATQHLKIADEFETTWVS